MTTRRCNHTPFDVHVHLPDGNYPGGTLDTTWEPDCDEDSCSGYIALPEEYEGCEEEWVGPNEVNLLWPASTPIRKVHSRDLDRWKETRQGCLERIEERGTSDMTPMIECYRDGEMIALVQCLQIDRDDALGALPMIVGGLALDAVVLCLDSHYTQSPINPTTGQPWGQGEMQKACDEDGACSTGIITDCLMVVEQHRDGYHRQVAVPYHEDKGAKRVHWHDVDLIHESGDATHVEGRIVDALNHAFSVQALTLDFLRGMDEGLFNSFVDLDDFAKRTHMDCAIAKELLGTDKYVVLLNGRSERGTEIINESFAGFHPEMV